MSSAPTNDGGAGDLQQAIDQIDCESTGPLRRTSCADGSCVDCAGTGHRSGLRACDRATVEVRRCGYPQWTFEADDDTSITFERDAA